MLESSERSIREKREPKKDDEVKLQEVLPMPRNDCHISLPPSPGELQRQLRQTEQDRDLDKELYAYQQKELDKLRAKEHRQAAQRPPERYTQLPAP